MRAIYYFENPMGCNPFIKKICQSNEIDVDYETKLYNLLSKIISFQPNFVVIDANNSNLNEQFFECFCAESPFYAPVVFVLDDNEKWKEKLKDSLNCLVLPYNYFIENFSNLLESVSKVVYFKQKIDNFQFTRFNEILAFLLKINFSVKNQGTMYLKDCIRLCLTCSQKIDLNLGNVYNDVGKLNQTTASAVERAIRLAIRSAWEDIDCFKCAKRLDIDPVFLEKQPSCRELIIFATEYLLSKAKEQCFCNVFPILKAKYV